MIVKNEEEVIERCLNSCKELFDEIIIVDTGSKDNTKNILKNFEVKILDFKWVNDFSKARNYGILNCGCDYFMWLDADDVITKENLEKLKNLKENLEKLNPNCVFINYNTGYDENGKVNFNFVRERILKNDKINLFHDPVHEAIIPREKIIYREDISIDHKKIKQSQKDRNLKIYEKQNKKNFTPRQMFYYARELYDNQKYKKSLFYFKKFLKQSDGFIENKIEACKNLSYIYRILNDKFNAKKILFESFCFDTPRSEILCEIGEIYFEEQDYIKAIYYYNLATKNEIKNTLGFVKKDCYNYIPYLQMCVCYYYLNDIEKAIYYNEKARQIKDNKITKFNSEFLNSKVKD